MPIPVYEVDQPAYLIEARESLKQDALAHSSDVIRRYYDEIVRGVSKSIEGSHFWHEERLFILLEENLAGMGTLEENWDSYGAPVPAPESIAFARQALAKFRSGQLLPEIVSPSAEGGVSIYFSSGKQKAFIEFLNEGDMVLARYGKDDEPNVKVLRNGLPDLDDQVLQEIRDHLGARA
jgi:hypothetical protein